MPSSPARSPNSCPRTNSNLQGWDRPEHVPIVKQPQAKGMAMTESNEFIGVDVSKAFLDIARRPSGEQWRVANEPEPIAALVERLTQIRPALIVLEATGGLEMALA